MADFHHIYGQDLQLSAVGGVLLLASGTESIQQRVIRRLLTVEGDHLFAPEGWAGLPTFIGQPASARRIRAAILKAMRSEAGVDQSKPITVEIEIDPITSTTKALVKYSDRVSANQSLLTIPIGA